MENYGYLYAQESRYLPGVQIGVPRWSWRYAVYPEELPQTNEKIASEQLNKDIITVEEVKDDIPEALGTEPSYIDESQKLTLQTLIVQKNVEEKRFLDYMGVDSLDHIISDEYEKAHSLLIKAKGNKAAWN